MIDFFLVVMINVLCCVCIGVVVCGVNVMIEVMDFFVVRCVVDGVLMFDVDVVCGSVSVSVDMVNVGMMFVCFLMI